MRKTRLVLNALGDGKGIVKLAPTWVPRLFLTPGKRLKLAPQDLYSSGMNRGGIDERWLASTTRADNPEATEDEGLSYVIIRDRSRTRKMTLRDAINEMGEVFLGKKMMREYGGWPILSKFFDNSDPIPLHLHQDEEHAHKVGREQKPEGYYFPPQLNNVKGRFPYTFFGLNPDTTKGDIKKCLERWNTGDNGILHFSKAYQLKPGTGWVIPPGVLHAPGTMVTYEPQRASDVFAAYQSMFEGKPVPWDFVVKDVPKEHHYDYDYILGMIDWEANIDPNFKQHHYIEPKPTRKPEETEKEGYIENWIIYGCEDFSAKELTIFPKKSVTIHDSVAYGLVVVQGRGTIGIYNVKSSTMIRYNELTDDELFVTFGAARDGVRICNRSTCENLVILKHFGPENPEIPKDIRALQKK